jgi:Flp pilus assembly pilin Flp
VDCADKQYQSTMDWSVMNKSPFSVDVRSLLSEFLTDERGARTIEYGLLAVGILVACIATAAALGTGLDTPSDVASYRPN